MRSAPTIGDFLCDDGSRFLRIGDLQALKEKVRQVEGRGGEDELCRVVRELIPRLENSCALLLRLLDERTPPI